MLGRRGDHTPLRTPRECGPPPGGSNAHFTPLGADNGIDHWSGGAWRRPRFVLATPALAQTTLPPVARTADLSGPRFGLTLLSDGVVKKLEERDITVGPHISQFGWQFEKLFYTRDSGVTMVTEWIGLVGGLEQSVVLPSLSWMVGVRTRDGAEFGIGPNVTPAGTALVFATGMTFRTGALNIPLNVAVVPSRSGTRVSILSGLSLRHR
jgi:hypothetical protein